MREPLIIINYRSGDAPVVQISASIDDDVDPERDDSFREFPGVLRNQTRYHVSANSTRSGLDLRCDRSAIFTLDQVTLASLRILSVITGLDMRNP